MNNPLHNAPFWQTKTLAEMTPEEWESLCDRCGKCCLHKLEDEDNGNVYFTSVACKLLDIKSCSCSNYKDRKKQVPECTVLTVNDIHNFHWLPATCAYRLLNENKPLYNWHPLVSGSYKTMHKARASVKGWVISENDLGEENDLEDYIIPHEMIR